MTRARMPFWLVVVLLVVELPVLAIWPMGIASNLYDEKRMLLVLLLAVVALMMLAQPSLRHSWQRDIEAIPRGISQILLVVLLLGVLSSWRATLPHAALAEIALWVLLFTLMIGVAAVRSRLGNGFDLAMIVMLALIFVINLLVTWGYVLQSLAGVRDLDFRLLFINFSHIRYFNQFQSWTLPLVVLPVLYAHARGWRILRGLLVIAAMNWWMLLYLSGGRGAFMALVISTLVVSVLVREKVRAWLKLQILTAVGGIVLFLILTQLIPDFVDKVIGNPDLLRGSLSGRSALWQLALTMIANHPLLGVGPMHYACSNPPLAGHPHNAVLQIAAEWGLPVVVLISGLLSWILFRAIREIRIRKEVSGPGAIDIAPMLLASLLAALVHAQVSGVIVTPISQIMMALIGGWLWSLLTPASEGGSRWRLPHTLWSLTIALSTVFLLSVVAPLWQDLIHGTIAPPDKSREFKPRFWIDGEICRDGSFWRVRQ